MPPQCPYQGASFASFYQASLAAGVLIGSLRGSNLDLLHVLFGTVLPIDETALYFVGGIASFTTAVLAIVYRPLVAECFDPGSLGRCEGAAATGAKSGIGPPALNAHSLSRRVLGQPFILAAESLGVSPHLRQPGGCCRRRLRLARLHRTRHGSFETRLGFYVFEYRVFIFDHPMLMIWPGLGRGMSA